MEDYKIEKFQYKNTEDIIITCTKLRALDRHLEAIKLYEKFENEIVLSDFELVF